MQACLLHADWRPRTFAGRRGLRKDLADGPGPVASALAQSVLSIPENRSGDKTPERETSFQDNPRTTRTLGDSAAARCALNHPLEELLQSANLEVCRNRVNPLSIESGSLKIFFESAEFRQALKDNVAGTEDSACPA